MVPSAATSRRAERVDDLPASLAAGLVDAMADLVGVDDVRAELGEHRADDALARADAAREPDDHVRCLLRPTPGGQALPVSAVGSACRCCTTSPKSARRKHADRRRDEGVIASTTPPSRDPARSASATFASAGCATAAARRSRCRRISFSSRTRTTPGPAVVIQHGANTSKDDFYIQAPARRWAAAGWTVLAIDLAEHGERASDPPLEMMRRRRLIMKPDFVERGDRGPARRRRSPRPPIETVDSERSASSDSASAACSAPSSRRASRASQRP